MSRKRDEKIRKLTETIAAVLDEIDDAIAALPEEFRDVLAGPGGEPEESDAEEPLDAPR